jgi:photosynthetic reaction center H subunit
MGVGAITSYIDVAQIVLYAFWIFFFSLIIYLRREDKREGYPLESDRTSRTDRIQVQGFPLMPGPKVFKLAHGEESVVPRPEVAMPLAAEPTELWPGAPLQPTGNPMLDGVGPAGYPQRSNEPELTAEGKPLLAPMRVATDFAIAARDPDPRGMPVLGGDNQQGAVVTDVWIDRAEPQIRYLEATTAGGRSILIPITFVKFDLWRRCVRVRSILGAQFATVPGLASPDVVTRLEEDRICAYYGGGTLYAEPSRLGPLL